MRIAISTGGGDAPGLNAVIRAATLSAARRGWETVGIRDGFNGLMFPELYPTGGTIELTRDMVRGIGHLGGTMLGSTNRGNPTAFPVQQDDGTWVTVDRTDELIGRRASERVRSAIEANRSKLEAWEAFCAELGHAPADVALAWLLHQPAVTAPIIGPRTLDQFTGALVALQIALDQSALDALDKIFPGPGGAAPEAYAW